MDIYRSLAPAWKILSAHYELAGERRKTNVEESKKEIVGGSFALSPYVTG